MRIGRGDRLGARQQRKTIRRKLLLQILAEARTLALSVIAGHPHRRGQEEPVVAGLIDTTGQRRQETHGAQRGDGVAAHGGADEGVNRRGPGGGKHFGGLADILGGDPGDLGHLFRRIGGSASLERVEADRPFGNEFLVIPTVGDDDVDHPESERAVRARPNAQPQLGLLGQPDGARIDDDGARALLLCILDPLILGGVSLGQVHAPQQNDVAILHVAVAGIGEKIAEGQHVRHQLRREALMRIVLEESGTAYNVAEHVVGKVFLRRQGLHRHRARAICIDDRAQALCNVVQRVVPAHPLPSARAAFAAPLHRVHDALGRKGEIQRCVPLHAQIALGQWMAAVASDPFDLASCVGFHDHAATDKAQSAGGLDLRHGYLPTDITIHVG